jgi:hypothetical protein
MITDADLAMSGSTAQDNFGPNLKPPTAQELAAFDRDAARGEQLDPQNAYFSLMRAAGLYTARRDREAQAEIFNASMKPAWREYSLDEVEGHWKIDSLASGGPEAIQRLDDAGSLLLPHYACLRAVGRKATYDSMRMEQAGQIAKGLALRGALMHCSIVMQGQTTTFIGALVGSAIGAIAMDRPGGAPHLKRSGSWSNYMGQLVGQFVTYADKNGNTDLVGLAGKVAQRANEVHYVTVDSSRLPGYGTSFYDLLKLLGVDAAVTANIIVLIALAAVSLVFGGALGIWRNASRVVSALQKALVILLPALIVSAYVASVVVDDSGFAILTAAVLAFGFIAATGLAVFRVVTHRMAARDLGYSLATGAAGSLAIVLTVLPIIWQAHEMEPVAALALMQSNNPVDPWVEWALYGAVATLPVFVLVYAACKTIAEAEPYWPGVLRRFRVGALVVTCVLIVVYAAFAIATANYERQIIAGLNQSIQGEGQYLAKLTGQTWPSPS